LVENKKISKLVTNSKLAKEKIHVFGELDEKRGYVSRAV